MDKKSSEWKERPAWVRAMFAGSSWVRMDRRVHERLEAVEVAAGIVLGAIGLCGLFDVLVRSATPFLVSSLTFFACAYVASINVRIGDRFGVWPWVQARSASP